MPTTAPTVLHTALATDLHTVLATQRAYLANPTRTTDAQTVALQHTALRAWTAATDELLALLTATATPATGLDVRVPPGSLEAYRVAYGRVLASYGRVGQASSSATMGGGAVRRGPSSRSQRRRGGKQAKQTSKPTVRASSRSGSTSSRAVAKPARAQGRPPSTARAEPPTTLFQRAWRGFLAALANIRHAIFLGARTFVSLLKQAFQLFFAGVKLALNVAFWPVRQMGALLQTATRAAARTVVYYWHMCTVIVCLTMGVVTIATPAFQGLLKRVFTSPKAHVIIEASADRIHLAWSKGCKGLVQTTVAYPQLTYDMLRVWHLLLADASAVTLGAIIRSIHGVCVLTVGADWSPVLGLAAATSAKAYYRGLRLYRTTHHGCDPLVQSYVLATSTKSHRSANTTSWTDGAEAFLASLFRRYGKGETEAVEDVRSVTLGRLAKGVRTDTRHLWRGFTFGRASRTRRRRSSAPNPRFDSSQHSLISKAVQTCVKGASFVTVHHLLCSYFVFAYMGTGAYEGVRAGREALEVATRAQDVAAAYETMGVAAKLAGG